MTAAFHYRRYLFPFNWRVCRENYYKWRKSIQLSPTLWDVLRLPRWLSWIDYINLHVWRALITPEQTETLLFPS